MQEGRLCLQSFAGGDPANSYQKNISDATNAKDELEKKIKMHTQLQEEISALENVSSFKSEEELNVMIQDTRQSKHLNFKVKNNSTRAPNQHQP